MREGILRSTFALGYGNTKIYLAFENNSYVVRSMWQDYYRSRKVSPNSAKGRSALEKATKKFEEVIIHTKESK